MIGWLTLLRLAALPFGAATMAIAFAAIYFKPRIEALAKSQGELGAQKVLEDHKATLQREAAKLTANLEKEIADHGIWAAERHKATALAFEGFARAQRTANQYRPFGFRSVDLTDYVAFAADAARDATVTHLSSYLYLSAPVLDAAKALIKSFEDNVDAAREYTRVLSESDEVALPKFEAYMLAGNDLSDRMLAFAKAARQDVHATARDVAPSPTVHTLPSE